MEWIVPRGFGGYMTIAKRIISLIEYLSDGRADAAEKAFSEFDFENSGAMITDTDGWQQDGPDKLIRKFYYDGMEGKTSDSSVFHVEFKPGSDEIVRVDPGF